MKKRVRIKVSEHEWDPPVGTVLEELGREPSVDGETVLVDWMQRRWPMLAEHVEVVAS